MNSDSLLSDQTAASSDAAIYQDVQRGNGEHPTGTEVGEKDGLVLHIQRLSTEDGPGIRTTVFLKQCPLHCLWCHNPESMSGSPELQWFEVRCIGCASCVEMCPRGALTIQRGKPRIDRARCDGCGLCAEECPSGALELMGTRTSVEALVAELLKDRTYYETSGGGVTFSGGEPLMQPDFVVSAFRRLKVAGIHTALDTCGLAARASLEKVLPYTDLFLVDIKLIDPTRHQVFTGQSNEIILENLLALREAILRQTSRKRLWIRTPLIPGATATRENVLAIGEFIRTNLPGVVERWELCAFNNLCRDQYKRLGLNWAYSATPLMRKDELDDMAGIACASVFDPAIVVTTGATRVEA